MAVPLELNLNAISKVIYHKPPKKIWLIMYYI